MSRYTAAHLRPAGPGDARPTALQIVRDEQLDSPALQDKVLLLTGASAGMGIETARALAVTGGRCFLGVRDLVKGIAACRGFLQEGRVQLFRIDTSSLDSVREAVRHIRAKTTTLNIVINNAGIMAVPQLEKSVDGFESQLANKLSSRVINVSSSGHIASGIHFDNLNLEGHYDPWMAYGQSKTAMIYMTNHIERLFGYRGLHGLSVMPGAIASNLAKHLSHEEKAVWSENKGLSNLLKSPAQGASTTVLAAVGGNLEGKGGKYLEDCDEAKLSDGKSMVSGYASHAFDEEKETRLWAQVNDLVGLARR